MRCERVPSAKGKRGINGGGGICLLAADSSALALASSETSDAETSDAETSAAGANDSCFE